MKRSFAKVRFAAVQPSREQQRVTAQDRNATIAMAQVYRVWNLKGRATTGYGLALDRSSLLDYGPDTSSPSESAEQQNQIAVQ